MKGFTDMMMAILIGLLLVFGALVFFATEVNNMTRSMELVMREYEIEMASNEFVATERGIETATLLGGANAVFDMGLLGFGDWKELESNDDKIHPTVWYINHTPPELYLFKGAQKEYRYVPTKDDVERKLGIVLDEYFGETNEKLNEVANHRIKLPGLNTIEIRLRNLGAGDVKIEQVPDYGTLSIPKISMSSIPGAQTSPTNKGDYVYVPSNRANVYMDSIYMPKCYVYGGTCAPIQGTNPDQTIKNELKCDTVGCGCPSNEMCTSIQTCDFRCPLDDSEETEMTSGFGCRNLNGMEFHPGVDLVYGNSDNKIYATSSGVLYDEFTGSESGGYGNMIVLANGCYDQTSGAAPIYFTIYAHLYSFEHIDWRISRGELIGYMGNTGRSIGKRHLHYEIRENGNKEYNGVLEVWRPDPYTNLVNPCKLSGGSICGSCDCKSECEEQGINYCPDCEKKGINCRDVCSSCSCNTYNGKEQCSG